MQLQRLIEASGGRIKRQPSDCPPPVIGKSGLPGYDGIDGEEGDPGRRNLFLLPIFLGYDGSPGLDAYQLLLEEARKCVVCPPGVSLN
jgi:hypothetical protein